MENSDTDITTGSDPGGMLRCAREAQGISAREMADRLNWMPDYVSAIEENRFDVLRGAAFVRGYLKSYAREVQLDEALVLAAYEALPAVAAAAEELPQRVESRLPQIQKLGWALPAGIALVIIMVLALWLLRGGDEPAVATPTAAPVEITEEPIADEMAAMTEAESESDIDLSLEPPGEAAPDLAQDTAPAEIVIEESPPSERVLEETIDPVAAAEPEAESATQSALFGDGLVFSFSGECWLEVRDADEKLIYADLQQAGDRFEVTGAAPFNILVGDARFVELSYQGEAVTITPRPGRVMARFSVGEQ